MEHLNRSQCHALSMKIAYLTLILLFIVGCSQLQSSPSANERAYASVGELFQLSIGNSVVIKDANIEIILDNAEDYRCPESVKCDTGGNFHADVILKDLDSGSSKRKRFFAFTDARFDYIVFKNYVIHPVSWKPERRSDISAMYEITFIVERGIAFDQQFMVWEGDKAPLNNGEVILSLDKIIVKKNENSMPKEPKSEATLYFKIDTGTKQDYGQINVPQRKEIPPKIGSKYVPKIKTPFVDIGEYRIILKELIGMQPYYHRFNEYDEEIEDSTQYRARIIVINNPKYS